MSEFHIGDDDGQEEMSAEILEELRAAGFDDAEIAAIQDFRNNATSEQKRGFVEGVVETGRELRDSDIPALEIVGRGIGDLLSNLDGDQARPPLLFDGEYVRHGLTQEEWEALDVTAKRTLREPF